MEIIKINNLNSLSKNKYIGQGYTSRCYLMPDDYVLKIYKDNEATKKLFLRNNMLEHLTKINNLKNDSYAVPERIYLKDDKVLAYAHPFIKAKTLKKLTPYILIKDFLESLKKLEEDTILISEKGFTLIDIHNKNILYDNHFSIIDLDSGYFFKNSIINQQINLNMRYLLGTISDYLFSLNYHQTIYFYNQILNDLYHKSISINYQYYQEFIKVLLEQGNLNIDNQIKDIRKLNLTIFKKG